MFDKCRMQNTYRGPHTHTDCNICRLWTTNPARFLGYETRLVTTTAIVKAFIFICCTILVVTEHRFIMCTPEGLVLMNDSLPVTDMNMSEETMLQTSTNTSDTGTLGFEAAEKALYSYVLPVICCFGILGNILNLVILSRKSLTMRMERLEKCANGHLIALALSDLMYCITVLPRSFKEQFVQATYLSPWLLYDAFHGAVINTFLLCSSWLTVAMAVSRYIAICYPVRARQHLGLTTTRMGIVCIFVISVIFNVPRFLLHTINWIKCQEGGYSYFVFVGPLRINAHVEHIYLWIYFVVGIILPLIAVAYCNIYFIRALQASKKLRRNSCAYPSSITTHTSSSSNTPNILTLTLSIIVVLYILLVTPAEIIQFFKASVFQHYHSNERVLAYYSLASALCNHLQTLNFAVNFLLYCMINVHFRRVIRNIVCYYRSSQTQHIWKVTLGERSSMLTTNTIESNCQSLKSNVLIHETCEWNGR